MKCRNQNRPSPFLGRRSEEATKPGFSFLGSFYVVVYYFVMDACLLCCVCFNFSVLSQEIDWEEHLGNDLLCVGWDVKPSLNQSITQNMLPAYIWMCVIYFVDIFVHFKQACGRILPGSACDSCKCIVHVS